MSISSTVASALGLMIDKDGFEATKALSVDFQGDLAERRIVLN
jgi:hypothetical protein